MIMIFNCSMIRLDCIYFYPIYSLFISLFSFLSLFISLFTYLNYLFLTLNILHLLSFHLLLSLLLLLIILKLQNTFLPNHHHHHHHHYYIIFILFHYYSIIFFPIFFEINFHLLVMVMFYLQYQQVSLNHLSLSLNVINLILY